MMQAWLKTVATIAPTIAAALQGPLAFVAAKIAAKAVGVDPKELEQAVLSGDSATLLAIKKAEQDFLIEMDKIGVERERMVALNEQSQHEQTQTTIRAGDVAEDEYVRHTRPKMAKQSWTATVAYCVGCFGVRAITSADLFDSAIAMILSAPAWAYHGMRTGDKFASAWQARGKK